MAAPRVETVTRTPMSWDGYLALPEGTPGEYYDGHLVTPPPPDLGRQAISAELLVSLRQVLPEGYRALVQAGWMARPGQEFIPDVMVFERTADIRSFTGTPVLIVLELRGGVFETVQTVTADQPAEVGFGIASVRIDLGELLVS